LDLKEDSLRQRLQLLPNPAGSVHESAIRSVEEEEEEGNKPMTAAEEELAAGLLNKASNVEVVSLSSDDLGDLPLEQLDKSEQLLTIQCSMVILAHAIPGTLAFTRTSLTFTADDSKEEYENASYLVSFIKRCFFLLTYLIIKEFREFSRLGTSVSLSVVPE
jgi:hypothetical protein